MSTDSAGPPPHTAYAAWLKDVVNTEHRDPAWDHACGSEEAATKFLGRMSILLGQCLESGTAPPDPSAKWQQCA